MNSLLGKSGTSVLEMSQADENLSSAYDMGFGDSDVETSSFTTDQDSAIPKDYWFGRKYFECVMAQSLLHDTQLDENVAEIDVLSSPLSRSHRENC